MTNDKRFDKTYVSCNINCYRGRTCELLTLIYCVFVHLRIKKKFRCIILVVKNANVSSLLMSGQNKFVIVLLQVLPVFSYGIAILRKFIGTSSDLRTITECPQFWQSNAK